MTARHRGAQQRRGAAAARLGLEEAGGTGGGQGVRVGSTGGGGKGAVTVTRVTLRDRLPSATLVSPGARGRARVERKHAQAYHR
eukprot:scaffold57428_cov67-Phaeocystis_antarctica.AAC.3